MAKNSLKPLGIAALALCSALAQAGPLDRIKHFVVLYQENHSFDNLYGGWEGVNGIANAHIPQVDKQGEVLRCLPQNDVNLVSPPVPVSCVDDARGIRSGFDNKPFPIETYIASADTTCAKPGDREGAGVVKGSGLPGGCTRDIVHRFYQEQYQLDGGKQDRYVAGSDAAGLVMGYYETKRLPIYQYLHRPGHPRYVIADNFFQAAFGGSFLNHQWLVAARTPEWPRAVNDGSALDQHSQIDGQGVPKDKGDKSLTVSCAPPAGRDPAPPGVVCGDFAVNTTQPIAWPHSPKKSDAERLPAQTTPTIGDRLTAAGIESWAWYSGGWANAEGDRSQPGYTSGDGPICPDAASANSKWPKCPDKLFQFHHQPFNYFAAYAPGTAARQKHLRDEQEFIQLAQDSQRACRLKQVSFVKALGSENEHPGYASEHAGNRHLVELIKAVTTSACAKDTMIIVTYDEFGGQADHVPPPSPNHPTGPYDVWGPGTRIPALIIAPNLAKAFAVDHTVYDTTSILATIEHRFRLAPLTSRDAAARDLAPIFTAK